MRRGRVFIFLALILLLALAGGFFFLQSQSAPSQDVVPTPAMVDIVIAEQPIPQGAVITDDVLGKISLPEGTNFDVMFQYSQREELLVGRGAKYPIEQGVVITKAMIGEPGDVAPTGPEWTNLISSGMTAISVPTTRLSSVAYGVADGSHVNVIACFLFVDVDAGFQSIIPNQIVSVSAAGYPVESPNLTATVGGAGGAVQGRVELDPTLQQPIYVVPSEAQRPRPVCQTIFQDVVVLKLGNFPVEVEAPAPVEGEQPPQDAAATPVTPDIVTLIVSPQDATSLAYMLYSGAKITLTLRGSNDFSRIDTEAATLQFLLSQYAIPVPAKLPYTLQPRIDALVEPPLLRGQ